MDRKRQKLNPKKNDVQKECQDDEKTALDRKFEHMKNKLKLNDVQKECQDDEKTALDRKFEHMKNMLKLNDVQKECQDDEKTALDRKFEHMKNMLKLNDVQKECQDDEKTALDRKFEHMKNMLKLNDVQKECQDDEKTALDRKFEHMKNMLKLNDVQKECQDDEKTALDRKFEHMKNMLKLNDVQKECQDDEKTALDRKFEHMKNMLKLNDVQKECQDDEKTALDRKFEHMKNMLKLNDVQKECQDDEKTALDRKFEHMKNMLKLNDVQKECQDDEKTALDRKFEHMKNMLKLVNESSDDAFDINSLPNEIILNVFGYLEQNQLGKIARVCRRWNGLTKSPLLWKKVNVKIFPSDRSEIITVKSFINRLPPCVTSIRLDFMEYDYWIRTLDFVELCVKLQEKCPDLEKLILTDFKLLNSLPLVIHLCTQYLQDVKILVFHHCLFPHHHATEELGGISKIEVLDLSWCEFGRLNNPQFSRMPCLKVLCLYGTNADRSWIEDDTSFLNQLHTLDLGSTWAARTFSAIQSHGLNLKELHICGVSLWGNHDLTFSNSVYPQLKTICLKGCYVTCEDIVVLIQSYPSLQNVHVDECVAKSFASHPFVVTNRCKSEIVKAIGWNHKHNVDYLHN